MPKVTTTKKTNIKNKQSSKSRSGVGSGGVNTTNSKINLKLVIPMVLMIAALGGYLVFKSFAAPTDSFRWMAGSKGVGVSKDVKVIQKKNGAGNVWQIKVPNRFATKDDAYTQHSTFTLHKDTKSGYGSYCMRLQLATEGRGSAKVDFIGTSGVVTKQKPGTFFISTDRSKSSSSATHVVCLDADLSRGDLVFNVRANTRISQNIIVWDIHKAQNLQDCVGTSNYGSISYVPYVPEGMMIAQALGFAQFSWNGQTCALSTTTTSPN